MLQTTRPRSDSSATDPTSAVLDAGQTSNGRQSGHSRITEALRQRIRNGDWSPGCAIPSRRHLAAEYKIAPATMERAIVPLLADGTLRADDRRGTFVAEGAAVSSPHVPYTQGVSPSHSHPQSSWTAPRVANSSPPVAGYHHGAVAIVASLYSPEARNGGQNDRWVHEIIQAMEHELAGHGRPTSFVNRVPRHAPEPIPLLDSLKQAIATGGVSGLALISFDLAPREMEAAHDFLIQHRLPVVSVVAEPLSLPVPHVLMDNHRAGYQAARYLLERGHRQLTVFIPERAGWAEERLAGVRAAADRCHLPPEAVRVLRGEDRPWTYSTGPMEVADQAVALAFEGGWIPDGPVICATDMAGIVLMDALTERGYAVGSQIPVLGFDDHELSRGAGLTTLCPPLRAMGIEAARLLLAGQESQASGCQVRLCSRLIPRASTQPAAHPGTSPQEPRPLLAWNGLTPPGI